jgi:hypothetical protein
MKPVYQTKGISSELDNEKGNCLRACLSSIFEINIACIPEFEEMGFDFWKRAVKIWLAGVGYELSELPIITHSDKFIPFQVGIGKSINAETNEQSTHAVVMANGDLAHDPMPLRNNIAYPELINLRYWYFTKLDTSIPE